MIVASDIAQALDMSVSMTRDAELLIIGDEFEKFGRELTKHIFAERLVNLGNNSVTAMPPFLIDEPEEVEYLSAHTLDIPKDGWYVYQAMLLPIASHADPIDGAYYDLDLKKYCYAGEQLDFDEFWDRFHDNHAINIFWYSAEVFSIAQLLHCYLAMEREKLNRMIKNGCTASCKEDPLSAKVDFLTGVLTLLEFLISHQEFIEAQSIIDKLGTCNGLCNDYLKDDQGGCGCG